MDGNATHTKHYFEFSESEVESELSVVSYQILKSVYFLYPVIPVCEDLYGFVSER